MSWGLLKGLGQGVSQVGGMMMQDALAQRRMQWQQEYLANRQQEQRDYQDRVRGDEQAFRKTLLDEQRDYAESRDAADVRIEERDGQRVKVTYNADGEQLRVEPYVTDPERQWYSAGDGTLFNAYGADENGNPITRSIGGDRNRPTKDEMAQAKAILGQFDEYSEPETEEEKRAHAWAKSIINKVPEEAPAADSAVGGMPRIGEVIDGYRFKGGNPNDPNSWELAR